MRVLTGMRAHSDELQMLFGLTCYNSCLFYIELNACILCRLANTLKNMQRSGQVTNVTAAGR